MRQILLCMLLAWPTCSIARAETRSETFDSDGVTIRYTLDGPDDGEPVLLIHGYMVDGTLNWHLPGVVGLLAKDYRVITIDNRGHGASDKPLRSSDYGAKMADDAIRLLDHLKIDKAHFAGYSMGGMITLKVLATRPERVASAVIGGMGWHELPERAKLIALLTDEIHTDKPLAACLLAFPDLGITRDELAEIKVPMTVLIGADDRLMERVKRLREVRPDVPVVEIAGANHMTCVMRPELRRGIKEFIDAHRIREEK